jgi:SAM-dependent methyltransferase
MQVYDEMADFYDLIYPEKQDLDFYLGQAGKARGKILEVACGTGRILLRLMRAGFDVHGIDLSSAMLDRLRKNALSEGMVPKVFQVDMRDFQMADRFRLIIVPFRSFHHLKSGAERRKALGNFHAHLEKGGRLILHLNVPSDREKTLTGKFRKTGSEKIPDGRVDWFMKFDRKNYSAAYRIALTSKSGKKKEFRMVLHFVDIPELVGLLESIGFKSVNVYCGFDYSTFKEGCEEAVVIADS